MTKEPSDDSQSHETKDGVETLPSNLKFDPLVGHPQRKIILAVMCLSLVVIVLDNSILNVAIPTISQVLSASDQQLLWIIDSYTLIFAGLLLTAGTLGDKFGRRTLLQIGLAIFGIASISATFANTPLQLIIARGVMGIGGAAIMPSTLSIITNVFPPRERAKAIGIWAAFAGIGVAIGPLTGGFLLEHFWWGSIFLVNTPIVIFGIIANATLVPESKAEISEKIDFVGAALSVVALISLLYGIIFGADESFLKPHVLLALGISAITFFIFFLWEAKTESPMLRLEFFKDRRFSAGAVTITLVFFAMFGVSFLLTQYLQSVLDFTALESGVRFIPFAVALIIAAPMSAKMSAKIGTKYTVVLGLTLVLVALISTTTLHVNDSYVDVVWMMVLMATGMGLTMAPATSSVMNSLPREKAGVGSAMNDTTRMIGGALGLAISGSVFASAYRNSLQGFSSIKDLLISMQGVGATKAESRELETNLSDSIGKALGISKAIRKPETIPDPALRERILSLPSNIRLNVSDSITESAKYSFVKGMHAGMLVSAVAIFIAIFIAFKWLPKHTLTQDQASGTSH